MKKLRRSLSLVLVFALVFGLVGTAFAVDNFAQFKDGDKVTETYTEAVDYLIAAGVVVGSDGSIKPQEILTREQAAKLVAYAMIGADAADTYKASGNPFPDVKNERWSSGYVQYVKDMSIMQGDSGNFRPADGITGIEFGKMCLVALGYGVLDEYIGNKWSEKVVADAVPRGIYDGVLEAASKDPLTREKAFQMLFNTATKNKPVKYNEVFKTYYTGDPISGDRNLDSNAAVNTKDTLGYQKFKLDKASTTLDDGRAGHEWMKGGKVVTGKYPDGDEILTVTDRTSESAIKRALDKDTTTIINGTYEVANDTAKVISDYAKDGYSVVLVDDPTQNGLAEKVIVTKEYLAKVDAVKGMPAPGITLKVYSGDGTTTNINVDQDDYDVSAFKKGDVVIVVPALNSSDGEVANDVPLSIKAATPEADTVLDMTDKDISLKTAGKKNYAGNAYYDMAVSTSRKTYASASTYNFYYNSNGYILGAEIKEEISSKPDFILIEWIQAQSTGTYLFGDTNGAAARVRGITTTGETVTLNLPVKKVTDAMVGSELISYAATTDTTAAAAKGDYYFEINGNKYKVEDVGVALSYNTDRYAVFAYVTDSEGYTTLKDPTNGGDGYKVGAQKYSAYVIATDVALVVNKANVTIDSNAKYATQKTALVTVNDEGKVNTKTGYANFTKKPDGETLAKGTDFANGFYVEDGNYVTDIVLSDRNEAAPPPPAATLIFAGGPNSSADGYLNGATDTYYKFTNGDLSKVSATYGDYTYDGYFLDSGVTAGPAKTVYTADINADGVITTLTPVAEGVVTYNDGGNGGYISNGQGDYYVTADTKVYNISGMAEPDWAAAEITEILDNGKYTVAIVSKKDDADATKDVAVAIYIVKIDD